uniref:Uncharacterized protein n=1 Tax=Ditylenchus dipsaci TaxID=166011 RepID=A0A915EEN1_9BILA
MSEVKSQSSSIEVHDAIINESWDWAKLHKNAVRIPINDEKPNDETFLGQLWRYWKEASINRRLARFKENEAKTFSKQRISKVHDILMDQGTKNLLAKRMMCAQNRDLLQETSEVLRRKYGLQMCDLLMKYSKYERDAKSRVLSISALESALDFGLDEVTSSMKVLDPLANWSKRNSDISSRMMARIQNLASSISSKVKWSFLVEPGRPQTDLSAFFSEFDVLEHFFEKIDLSSEEVSQKAFDSNYLVKARNRKLECVDISRVKLTAAKDEGRRAALSDFIHANFVYGGPLLNKFILTQAPLPQTVSDFWRMVWQQKSEYIFMLCSACDAESLGLKDESLLNHCPFYWPRHEGEVKKFGKLVVRNEKLDTTIDPLFNVTHLLLWMEEEPAKRLRVQHWQWDWKDYTDFHWPYRLLLRSRQSKRPTVVQCMDGCGKSGTLVLIEIFLMQLLRGATSYENPMITSAIFLRLQRRHAIASPMQFLYAYRTVLHWMEPFIVSSYHRFVLGLMMKNTGFLAKYDLLSSAGKKSHSIKL